MSEKPIEGYMVFDGDGKPAVHSFIVQSAELCARMYCDGHWLNWQHLTSKCGYSVRPVTVTVSERGEATPDE